jgi:hypothetical protein
VLHPLYEGWNNTPAVPPACCADGKLGQGCCHTCCTTAYIAVIDEVRKYASPRATTINVIRWRLDSCEQSPQIWSGCGDVTITE